MQNKIQILSTKKIDSTLIQLATENNICVDQLNFIQTEECISDEIKKRIIKLSKEKITAIFTSSKTVNVVRKIVSKQTNWKIYCIEPATKKTVENIFTSSVIAGSAKDAAQLAEKISKDDSVKQIVFFCGNQRRNTLPKKLRSNEIKVEELVVYKTIEKPQLVSKTYAGILFFSPSAVKSFFSSNKIKESTTLFAIGNTTAEEVRLFTKAKIIIAGNPEQKELINDVIKYYTSIKIL
jgi:uroporphyrinogen-III synthase